MPVGLIFDRITLTNLTFAHRSVCFLGIALCTKGTSVSMFLPIEFISLARDMIFMRTIFPLPICLMPVCHHLLRNPHYFPLTKLWILHILRLCLLIMVLALAWGSLGGYYARTNAVCWSGRSSEWCAWRAWRVHCIENKKNPMKQAEETQRI